LGCKIEIIKPVDSRADGWFIEEEEKRNRIIEINT
jgi:hypothetical protein